jgi:antirestriction protein ArdC
MIYHTQSGNKADNTAALNNIGETRLSRDFGQTRFGDVGYALEELAGAFISATIGLPADHLEDHANYSGGWLKALGDNPNAFLTTASRAQAAADWVLQEMGLSLSRDERS